LRGGDWCFPIWKPGILSSVDDFGRFQEVSRFEERVKPHRPITVIAAVRKELPSKIPPHKEQHFR
jgi:hypothetical protein